MGTGIFIKRSKIQKYYDNVLRNLWDLKNLTEREVTDLVDYCEEST